MTVVRALKAALMRSRFLRKTARSGYSLIWAWNWAAAMSPSASISLARRLAKSRMRRRSDSALERMAWASASPALSISLAIRSRLAAMRSLTALVVASARRTLWMPTAMASMP